MRRKIRALVKRWAKRLGLDGWIIRIVFEREGSHPGVLADVAREWTYRDALVTFYTRPLSGCDDAEIERVVIHELLHVVLSEMSTQGKSDHEERVVTTLARAFYDAVH